MIPTQPIKRTKQSVFLDVTVFRHTTCGLAFTPNAAVLFVDVAIQPEVRFIAKQKFAYENREQRQSRFGPIFDESTPCLMIVLMNCQTKLRINHFDSC
ncbi:hypothetical protein TNCV_3908721 [Trichonephila clavipes]|nr:hypothetical protein TNCV_3908721 [Trichonephila clavipes]